MPRSVRFASSTSGRIRMRRYFLLQALKLQRNIANANQVVVFQFFACDPVRSVVEPGAIGGVKIGENEAAVLVAEAGMSCRNGSVLERDLAIRRRANYILSFMQPEIFSLLVAGQSHEPSHDRESTTLRNNHGSRRCRLRGS